MATYLQIINIIRDTALAQPNVNSVVREFLDLNREDAKYSAIVIQDRDGSRDRIVEQDYITYTWHLGYVDRLVYDESNRDDIISTGINIINNIVNTIRNTWFPELEVSVIDRINTFDQRFTAQCAGVYVVLAVNAQVSDCVDSESTDLYDKFEVNITENGAYHFVPSGRPVDEINITVDVESSKPEESLVETITSNGSYHYDPTPGSVFSGADITVNCPVPKTEERGSLTIYSNGSGTLIPSSGNVFDGVDYVVDVHPSDKLVKTITSNGTKSFSGEWKDAEITVDVHPSTSLSETYISNGDYNITGEFNGGVIIVDVPAPQFVTETLNVSANGTYNPGEGVDGYSQVVVDVPQSVTGFTEKEITEGVQIVNLSNSASYVSPNVFANNRYIQTVNLPNCISVGDNAFIGCPSLTSVSLPNCEFIGFSVFNNCTNLQNINIENCLFLSGSTFTRTKISEINLPKCRYLSGSVFNNCRSLVSISLPKCEYLYGEVFGNTNITSISLPNCKYIIKGAFYYCSLLSSVSLPNCVYIDGSCFRDCSSLSMLDLPNCEYVGSGVFYWANLLSSVSLPNCRHIGGIAFQYCHSLSEKLNLPACGYIGGAVVNDTNVTKANIPMAISFNKWYGNPVFCTSNFSELHLCIDVYGCPSYSDVISTSTKLHSGEGSIYVNEQNYSYFISASGWSNISSIIYSVSGDSYPLISGSDGLLYGGTKAVGSNYSIYTNINSTNLTSVSLPNCEFIDELTFQNCYNLTSVSLPNCKYIGYEAFNRCSNIAGFSLPNCKFISDYAFSQCYSSLFTSLTLPNCKYIGAEAFYNCHFVSEIYFPGSEVCYIDRRAMWNTGGGTVKFYVPASLIDEYKTALWWSSMANRIFPIE